ncbi:MAG: ParB/RepB/Spo0J family partition protein [Treponema sp.]|nr:ParB/RepB/Spo0J family partition protein [Treponema sp.]
MKLPTNNANHIKVPLSCLKITDNVRMNFDEAEIEELANSIRQNGLMNPITVRPPETDADGNKTYEVIAGGRRIRAHQWLCEHGDDFSLIECCIRTGDKWALQMIENIQRTDLTPREKENAVAKALEEGLAQTQIADKLSKPIQWVSDIVAGAKIRKIADAAGLDTEEITTKTLSQLRSIPEEKLESRLTQLIAEGGTYRAATRMMQAEKNPATTHVSTINENLPNGLYLGVEVDKVGKRLFFKDLLPGKFFILNQSTDSLIIYKLCQIVQINKDHAYFSDGTKVSVNNGASVSQLFVDGNRSNDWIYDISPETKPFPSTVLRFKDDDESMISPSEMSEGEFYDDEDFENENEIDEERERKEQRFSPGTEIDKIGERLHFADLWMGRNFILPVEVEKNKKYIVAQVTSFNGNHTQLDCYWWTDERDGKGHNVAEKTTIEDFLIDSDEINSHWWIYAIPDDAVAVHLVDHNPIPKTNIEPQQAHEAYEESNEDNFKLHNSRTSGVKVYQLSQIINKIPSNTSLRILLDSKIYKVFSVEYDKENQQLIIAHDPWDEPEK